MSEEQRSDAVRRMGILHLVGGGLGLIISFCVGVGLLVNLQPLSPNSATVDITDYMVRNVPHYASVQIGSFIVGLLFDALLLSAGLGLLNRQAWARYASLVYAVLSLIFKIAVTVYDLALVKPALDTFLAKEVINWPAHLQSKVKVGATTSFYGGVALEIALLIYPIVVLVVLLRPSAARSLEHVPVARREDPKEEKQEGHWREELPDVDRWSDQDRPRDQW